jgi:O-antigen/teichoic acid export membrane protein
MCGDEPEEINNIFENGVLILAYAGVLIFVPITVLLPDFITLWISPGFSSKCSLVGQLIAVSSIPRGTFQIYTELFKGVGKPKYNLIITICSSITIIIANCILITKYGIIGAGYSYCISMLWGCLGFYLAWRIVLKHKNFIPLLKLMIPQYILGALCGVFCLLLRKLFPQILTWVNFFLYSLITVVLVTLVLVGYDYLINREKSIFMLKIQMLINNYKLKFSK